MAISESHIPNLYADALAGSRSQQGFISRGLFRRAVFVTEVAADFITCAAAIVAAYLLQLHLGRHIQIQLQNLAIISLLHGLFAVLLLRRDGAYRGGTGLLRIRETERATRASIQSLLLLFLLSFSLKLDFPITMFLAGLALTPALLIVQRQVLSSIVQIVQAKGCGIDRVVVYGTVESGKRISSVLLYSPRLGLSPVAIAGDDPIPVANRMVGLGYGRRYEVPVQAGPITTAWLKSLRCDLLLVAAPHFSLERLTEIVAIANQAGVAVAFSPGLADEESEWAGCIDADGPKPASMGEAILPRHYGLAKRGVDIAVSSFLLVLLSPLLVSIALLIQLSSRGPAIFVQKRVGRNGKLFDMYKFRSMYTSAARYDFSPTQATDPRITRFGRFIRRTSLDELPQLVNVVLGNMSLVGPRPEMLFIVKLYNAEQMRRLEMTPGITGLWQLSGDRALPIHESIEYDLYYMRNRTFFMDVAILIHTALFAAWVGV